jgi:hypothetical protein
MSVVAETEHYRFELSEDGIFKFLWKPETASMTQEQFQQALLKFGEVQRMKKFNRILFLFLFFLFFSF